ncbi:restriction endonuclease subunit S [Ferrimicrobium sp.]|jgi:type I restriction enzyme S subunit|uniref:restriction endonuclease subunit S n=1 Tax=Ferrimicrobium sp. TaxID=2926050 RepID=UPI00260ACF26|nr:restriction endonuclease subunit S [Ferrimicrobium sp.]
MTLGAAFLINPRVSIAKGSNSPFVDMSSLKPSTRGVSTTISRPYSGGSKFLPGDVLMARITPSLENGKTAIYFSAPGATGAAFGSTEFIVFRGREGLSDTNYGYYLLTSNEVREHAIASMNGSSGRQRVQLDSLASYEIDLPPLNEQRAIAATLGVFDDKIESNRRAIQLIEDLCHAHFDRLFDVSNNDEGVPLSQHFEVNPRRSLSSGQVGTYVGMASLPEFSAEIYNWEEKPAGSGQRFVNGDVLMARITPCLENGKTAVVDMLDSGAVGWGSTEYIVLAPKGNIGTEWIYCLVRNEAIRTFAIVSMTGTSGRQRFQADRFDQYKIACPPEAALSEFNSLATPQFSRMTQMRNETLDLLALRDALLPELLSGRIRITDAEHLAEMER